MRWKMNKIILLILLLLPCPAFATTYKAFAWANQKLLFVLEKNQIYTIDYSYKKRALPQRIFGYVGIAFYSCDKKRHRKNNYECVKALP